MENINIMKTMKLLDLFLLLSLCNYAFSVQQGCVELYEHCNYQGNYILINF